MEVVTIQIKAVQQYFPVVCSFIILYGVVSLSKVWPFTLTKAIEQYFPVVLFIMLFKVFLTSESVDEILLRDCLNES